VLLTAGPYQVDAEMRLKPVAPDTEDIPDCMEASSKTWVGGGKGNKEVGRGVGQGCMSWYNAGGRTGLEYE
jgi:hypothetical protein